MTYTILALSSLFGLVFGSFAGATVWRLRARQLTADKRDGERVDARELKRLKPLAASTLSSDRSRCLSCGHTLAWYDLIPLYSWLSTKGCCRYCQKPIGAFEPLMELGSALLFGAFTVYAASIGLPIWLMVVWVPILVLFVILFAYDYKWFILPDVAVFSLIGLSSVIAIRAVIISDTPLVTILSIVGSLLILSGLYLVLWMISKGEWVGFGDVKLGIALALLLVDWQLAFLTLFLANLLGTLIVLPGLVMKRLTRRTAVPFGPLLIAGFFISLFCGAQLIEWYIVATNSLTTNLLML